MWRDAELCLCDFIQCVFVSPAFALERKIRLLQEADREGEKWLGGGLSRS